MRLLTSLAFIPAGLAMLKIGGMIDWPWIYVLLSPVGVIVGLVLCHMLMAIIIFISVGSRNRRPFLECMAIALRDLID